MSLDKFRQWKHKYDTTVPIRGRAVECRPWGNNRSRDWEQIIRVLTPYGESYSAKLYDTDCVVVNPDGSMDISTGAWGTPLTAEWISNRSGFHCYKKYNSLWLEVGGRCIQLENKRTHINYDPEANKYSCEKKLVAQQKVVDRTKIKEVRHSVKDVKSFVKVMMKLGDGWVSNELVTQYRHMPDKENGGWYQRYEYHLMGEKFGQYQISASQINAETAERLLKCMQNIESDTDKVQLMLILADGCNSIDSRIVASIDKQHEYGGNVHKYTEDVREYQYNPDTVVRRIDYIIKKCSDVFTTKEVEVTKPMTNLM